MTFRLNSCDSSVASCLLTLGEVRGILSATTVNSLVNIWAMTGTDSGSAAAWIFRRHTRPTLMTLKLINLCVTWLLRVENSQCWGVLKKHHLWWWESKRDCNAKLSLTSKGIEKVQVMVVRAAYTVCRPTHYSRIHSGLTHAQDRIHVYPTNFYTISQLCSAMQRVSLYKPKYITKMQHIKEM